MGDSKTTSGAPAALDKTINRADYAAAIEGFRLFQATGDRSDFQLTATYSHDSAMRLLTELPEGCQLIFFDPEARIEEAYVLVRRAGSYFKTMRGGHGWSSHWRGESLSRIANLFMESPPVKNPPEQFESFSVLLIPEHQRRAHII